MDAGKTVKESVLRELVRASLANKAIVRGATNGFLVVAQLGEQEKILETARGGVRLFASLDTAASFVHEIGFESFEVEMKDYRPGRLRKARPDRAEALKRTRTHMRQQELKGWT